MADHTPGPWETYDPCDGVCGSCCTPDGCHECHPAGECCVIGPETEFTIRLDNWADARLIAAAPDLLAACKAVALLVATEYRGGNGKAVMKQVRDAIAKATGEETTDA